MELTDKQIEKIQRRSNNGIRTIFVEGIADQHIYKRIYSKCRFIAKNNGFSGVIKKVKEYNNHFGKNPLVVGIIDKDRKTESELNALLEENIFAIEIQEIEFIFLRPDVITNLFGERFFQEFQKGIIKNAQDRIITQEKTLRYDEACNVLKKQTSSKYIIRQLIKGIGRRNRGNDNNIEFLCKKMDEKNAWGLVKDIFPSIDECLEKKDKNTKQSLSYVKLDYTPKPILSKPDYQKSEKEEENEQGK